jgi:hypothetical protein
MTENSARTTATLQDVLDGVAKQRKSFSNAAERLAVRGDFVRGAHR